MLELNSRMMKFLFRVENTIWWPLVLLYRIGWYWADILFGGNLRRMNKTSAEGMISTNCY